MGQSFSTEPVVEKHTETDRNEIFDAAVSSCQGWRFSQEDDHSLKLCLPGEHKASFFAVFDGHGSAKVSKHASESLWRHLSQNEMYIKGNFKVALEESFLTFDREVYESYNAQLAGTTAVCILIVDNVIYCANIGDSRAVAAVNCECIPLSHDHKPENPVELKRILAAGGYVLGNRVNGNLALSRAFGDFHYKSNEQLPPDQQIVSPFPEIKRIELTDDVDFIVLACDGIWDVLSSEEVINFVIARLEQEVRPDQICEQLTTRCLATDYDLVIGCDNMTVLLVCYTRGRDWANYCTDIFNKNSKRMGMPNRPRVFDNSFSNEQNNGNATTSCDLSRDSGMNNTFVNYDTSSADTDASSTQIGLSGRDLGTLVDSLMREINKKDETNDLDSCTSIKLNEDNKEPEKDSCTNAQATDDNSEFLNLCSDTRKTEDTNESGDELGSVISATEDNKQPHDGSRSDDKLTEIEESAGDSCSSTQLVENRGNPSVGPCLITEVKENNEDSDCICLSTQLTEKDSCEVAEASEDHKESPDELTTNDDTVIENVETIVAISEDNITSDQGQDSSEARTEE